jgi:hypothetical protein
MDHVHHPLEQRRLGRPGGVIPPRPTQRGDVIDCARARNPLTDAWSATSATAAKLRRTCGVGFIQRRAV